VTGSAPAPATGSAPAPATGSAPAPATGSAPAPATGSAPAPAPQFLAPASLTLLLLSSWLLHMPSLTDARRGPSSSEFGAIVST